MRTGLVAIEDERGAVWRLALDEPSGGTVVSGGAMIVLECADSKFVEGWVLLETLSGAPESLGVTSRRPGVIVVDDQKLRGILLETMTRLGASPKASPLGLADFGEHESRLRQALPMGDLPGRVSISLLDYVAELQACSSAATPGRWLRGKCDADFPGWVLDAVITGDVTDPVAESMSPEDVEHVIATQPQAVDAIVAKLREAAFLLEDLHRAARAAREEIDHLNSPRHRTKSYADRVDMFDRWMASLSVRCTAFMTIDVPDPAATPVETRWTARPREHPAVIAFESKPMSREEAVALFKKHWMAHYTKRHPEDLNPPQPSEPSDWAIAAIIEAYG